MKHTSEADLTKFFELARTLSKKGLSQKQVDGFKRVYEAVKHLPVAYQAYLIATVWHETAATMTPIVEYGPVKYFDKYDTGKLAKQLGNTPEKDGDGFKFRGRGDVMITGLANYRRASKALGKDFVSNPDGVLAPEHSAKILVAGCTEGWFTGKKLSDYLDKPSPDYVNARRVINGVDKATTIAGYAVVFERALKLITHVDKKV